MGGEGGVGGGGSEEERMDGILLVIGKKRGRESERGGKSWERSGKWGEEGEVVTYLQ